METVTVGTGPAQAIFGPPRRSADGGLVVPLHLSADGLEIDHRVELQPWSGGQSSILAFFADLAERWRGWQGIRQWNDDSGTLALSATHNGVGEVLITLGVDPAAGWEGGGAWRSTAMIAVEPGALADIDEAFRQMLG